MAQRNPKLRNIYYDYFAERFEFYKQLPYSPTDQDWVLLDRLLTKSGTLSQRLTIEVFQRAVDHFLMSEVGIHSLSKLCSPAAFVSYWRGVLDRYGKPKEVRNNGTRTGMHGIQNVEGLPWQIRFAQRVNKAYDVHPVPEMAAKLTELFDQMENEQLNEAEAIKRLEAIEKR